MVKKIKLFWSFNLFLNELEPQVNTFLSTLPPSSITDIQLNVSNSISYAMVTYTEIKQ